MLCDKYENQVLDKLASLYKRYGYKRYKLGCFEEYSLYQENKDFLIGKNVITFSDLSGRLMAMRPDVTLSVIKHNDIGSGQLEKFYYNEKVFRQTTVGQDYKEINQTGVEVIGKLDSASIAEVAVLICETLSLINENYFLDLSHMGFTEGLLSEFTEGKKQVLCCLKRKDLHDFYALAEKYAYPQKVVDAVAVLIKSCGNYRQILSKAKQIAVNSAMLDSVKELEELCFTLEKFGYGNKISINFSVANDADYYNGVVFNGYLEGVPHCVLSGGRYDKLLEKLNKNGGAIGFALYLGEIERYFRQDDDGVDYLIIYDARTQNEALELQKDTLKCGKSVRISNCIPDGLNYKNKVDLTKGEVLK